MTDYIKRETALESLRIRMDGTGYQEKAMGCINRLLVPCENVAPVRRGKWKYIDHVRDLRGRITGDLFECTACNYLLERVIGGISMNYCPNCGAKMRERKDNVRLY